LVRGERDYTQRVLATVRPMGLLGGRLILLEDFESLKDRSSLSTANFSITTSAGDIWDGDAAGMFTMGIDEPATWYKCIPSPTSDIIGAEVIFRPSGVQLGYAYLQLDVYTDAARITFRGQLIVEDGAVKLQVWTTGGVWTTVKTFNASEIPQHWHFLYIRCNIATQKYELVQLNSTRVALADQTPVVVTGEQMPYVEVTFTTLPLTGDAETVYWDDLAVTYEEL